MEPQGTPPTKEKQVGTAAKPFSIRLTDKERDLLTKRAGGQPLGTYLRERILSDHASAARGRGRISSADREGLARVLAALGRSEIVVNLNKLAAAASIGALDLSPEVMRDLDNACRAVIGMRSDLIRALGLKDEGER